MTIQELFKAIDYYLENSQNYQLLFISIFAIILSLAALGVSIYTFKKQHSETIYGYLAKVWNDVLDVCLDNPNYLDIIKTEHYHKLMPHEDALKYDAYCYKAWGHVEDIISKGFQNDAQFEPIIRWVATYHYTWLERNPTFFSMENFWEKVERLREKPNLVFGYKQLPSKDGDIDWDVVSEDYHNYILGPFAPEMVLRKKDGKRRNLLIDYLCSIPSDDLKTMDVADFGCGPGNLFPQIVDMLPKITGIDISESVLDIAGKVAKECNIKLDKIKEDIRNVDTSKKYDLIISVNSVLPKNREDVLLMLGRMRESLKPSGKLLAILPSFDTTIYLKKLWLEYYRKMLKNESHIKRIAKAFDLTKKVNTQTLTYADDGHNIQCYHTPDSIKDEFHRAGLRLIGQPEKVYYPWELTKRFDYGYFPLAPQEIWDWFVVAERSSINKDYLSEYIPTEPSKKNHKQV